MRYEPYPWNSTSAQVPRPLHFHDGAPHYYSETIHDPSLSPHWQLLPQQLQESSSSGGCVIKVIRTLRHYIPCMLSSSQRTF